MRYFQTGSRKARSLYGLVHGLQHMVVLIAHVDGVEGVVLRHHFVEFHHFPGVAVTAGGVFKAVREPYGSELQLVVENPAHFLQVFVSRLDIVGTHYRFADVAVPHEARVVDAYLVLCQAAVARPVLASFPRLVGIDEGAVSAVAADLAGDALIYAAVALGGVEQIGVGVGVDVDESGGYRQSHRIDHGIGIGAEVFAYGGDLPVADRYVALYRGLAVSGEYYAVLDDGVERALRGHLASSYAGESECGCTEHGSLEEIPSVHIIVFLCFLSGKCTSCRPPHRPEGPRARALMK